MTTIIKKTTDNIVMLNTLVDYVKEHQDGNWCVITQRDVPKITGCSTFAARKLLEMLKQHPNIIFEIDESRASRRKPFQFRYVTEEEKKQIGIPDDGFYYLSKAEVQWIKKVLYKESFSDLHCALSFLNIMALSGSKKNFALTAVKDLTRYCPGGEKEARRLIAMLVDHRLLLIDPNMKDSYFLQLDEAAIIRGAHLLEQSAKRIQIAAVPLSEIEHLQKVGIPVADSDLSLKKEFNTFVESFSNLAKMLHEVDQHTQGKLESVLARYNWLNSKEEELEKSYRISAGLVEEDSQLKIQLEEKEKALRLLTKSNANLVKRIDGMAVGIAQRVDGLQAELLQEVENFMYTPAITLETCNLFKKNTVQATLDASRDIGLIMVKKEDD